MRHSLAQFPPASIVFQSTHPLRGATNRLLIHIRLLSISIHAPLAGCDSLRPAFLPDSDISIHAPLAGCDYGCEVDRSAKKISIHAPLAGCDHDLPFLYEQAKVFQSTHPLRGATRLPKPFPLPQPQFQSTHPLRGATRTADRFHATDTFQSTHPLRGATSIPTILKSACKFQSTHPLRGATAKLPKYSR